jgi:hypothetical protein
MSLIKSIAGNEICDQTARNSIDSLRKTANPYNLITISPYNLKPDSNYNKFTTLNTVGDDASSLCVQGGVSDQYLMFCGHTKICFRKGQTIKFSGCVPNWGSENMESALYVWLYGSNYGHIRCNAGTRFTLSPYTWNYVSGSVTVPETSDATYFLVGLSKSKTTCPIGLTMNSYCILDYCSVKTTDDGNGNVTIKTI